MAAVAVAAAAVVVIRSSLSTSMQTLNHNHFKVLSAKLKPLKMGHTYADVSLSIGPVFRNGWVPRVSAAVLEGEVEVAGEEEEGDDVNTKLYFGNLPYGCDSAQLAGMIQEYGSPEIVEVLYDRVTGKSRGYAFATMSSIEDCNAVIENLDGRLYGGRTLMVNFSDKPKPKEPLYPETEYKLFVGNLSWSVTAETLTQAFQQYGHVVGARVLYDGETGRSRSYGFVCYQTQSEMDAALASLNGVKLDGRAMRVRVAQGRRS